jgi:hypothetical protein
MTKFFTDFDFFTQKIRSDEPFALVRYGDGEIALMQGEAVGVNTQAYNVDGWFAPAKLTLVGRQLLDTLGHTESNYHYAIPTPTEGNYQFFTEKLQTTNITFANLWVNANYQKMKEFYTTLDKSVYVVCNQNANPQNFPFDVLELFPFPEQCISYWEWFGEGYLQQLIEYTSQVSGQTFFISAGPVSEILIHHMYQSNPNNQYIDVGSSIDEFVHGRQTRPYMNPATQYAQQVSYFEEGV